MKLSIKKTILKLFKFIAIVAFLLMLGHVVFLLIGCPMTFAEDTVFLSPGAGLMSIGLSIVLKYCYLHQLCLSYTCLVSKCIAIQQYGSGFGEFLLIARHIALIVGLVILVLLLVKKVDCKLL